jgi:ClpA/ClpB-like protein
VKRETGGVFERFTDRARRVVVLAQEEARLLNHNYIGTEHLLLGLLREDEGIAAQALDALGVSTERARHEVEAIIGHGDRVPSGHVPFTPRAKKVLELSLREAIQLGHNYIGTEHILLGLVREGEGVAATVLVKLGADLERVRRQVVQLLTAHGNEPDVAQKAVHFAPAEAEARRQRVVIGGPRDGCMFCGRDLYEVERAVASSTGALLCKDCAWLALQTMERAAAPTVPLQPLRMPPRVFGGAPDDDAVAEITALFGEHWGVDHVEGGEALTEVGDALRARWGYRTDVTMHVDRIRFLTPNEAAVRFVISALPEQPFDGRVRREGERWLIGRETFCQVAALGGVPCPPDIYFEDAGDDDDAA